MTKCEKCNYESDDKDVCPVCGTDMHVVVEDEEE